MPEELHRRLAMEAERSGRSVDQQAIAILDRALQVVPPVVLPIPIVPLRPVTEDEITAAFVRPGMIAPF
jgi:hypothetical protein